MASRERPKGDVVELVGPLGGDELNTALRYSPSSSCGTGMWLLWTCASTCDGQMQREAPTRLAIRRWHTSLISAKILARISTVMEVCRS